MNQLVRERQRQDWIKTFFYVGLGMLAVGAAPALAALDEGEAAVAGLLSWRTKALLGGILAIVLTFLGVMIWFGQLRGKMAGGLVVGTVLVGGAVTLSDKIMSWVPFS